MGPLAQDARRGLVRLLQAAFSGEMAAAFAYRGHWKSVRDPAERGTIARIEREEWTHREIVGRMLAGLGARPRRVLEIKAWTIGRLLGAACFLSGRYLPMYFAWKLETRNVCEYDAAAGLARACGQDALVPELAWMADIEREHELFFGRAAGAKTRKEKPCAHS